MKFSHIVIFLGAILLIAAALEIRQQAFYKNSPTSGGETRALTITIKEGEWRFVPDSFDAKQGETIAATIVNEDSFDHGFAVDAFGVSKRIPAKSTVTTDFVASQTGDFAFYCSIVCGEGAVNGKIRGHFDMKGMIHVK